MGLKAPCWLSGTGAGSKIKSDQNGIESDYVAVLIFDNAVIKSDQNGIESVGGC